MTRVGLLGVFAVACASPATRAAPPTNRAVDPPTAKVVTCYHGRDVRGRSSSPVVFRRTVDPAAFRIIEERASPGVSNVETWRVDRDGRSMRRDPGPHSGLDGGEGEPPTITGTLSGPRWRWTTWQTDVAFPRRFTIRATTTRTETTLTTVVRGVSRDGSVFSTSTMTLQVTGCDGFEGSRDMMQIE